MNLYPSLVVTVDEENKMQLLSTEFSFKTSVISLVEVIFVRFSDDLLAVCEVNVCA